MSVAMTNCGTVGWVSDRTGYRYDSIDPTTGQTWPAMPQVVLDVATEAASAAGFVPMRASSTVTRRAHVCRFIRTATNAIWIADRVRLARLAGHLFVGRPETCG